MGYPGLAVTIGLLAALIFMPSKNETSPVAIYFQVVGLILMLAYAAIGAYVDRQR